MIQYTEVCFLFKYLPISWNYWNKMIWMYKEHFTSTLYFYFHFFPRAYNKTTHVWCAVLQYQYIEHTRRRLLYFFYILLFNSFMSFQLLKIHKKYVCISIFYILNHGVGKHQTATQQLSSKQYHNTVHLTS